MTRTLTLQLPGLLRTLVPCFALFLLWLGLVPETAKAGGFYRVAECSPGHLGTPDATRGGLDHCLFGSDQLRGRQLAAGPVRRKRAGGHHQAVGLFRPRPAPGSKASKPTSASSAIRSRTGIGRTCSYAATDRRRRRTSPRWASDRIAGTYDSTIQDLGPFAAVGVGMFCSKPTGTCDYAPNQLARMSARLVPDGGPHAPRSTGGRRRCRRRRLGSRVRAACDRRDGRWSGVYRTTIDVGGDQIVSDVICQPGQDAGGYVSSMRPCDPIELRYLAVDTTGPAFSEGPGNQVRVCTHEYGFAAASTCTAKTLRVDNVAPEAPQDLEVSGGEGWRRDNDFDLTWSNPPQAHAPIEAATVEVAGPDGHVSTTTRIGHDIESIEDVSVPAAGAYRAEVFLRDAAGNESSTAVAAVDLEFDDTVPTASRPGEGKRLAVAARSQRRLRPVVAAPGDSEDSAIRIGGLPGSRERQPGLRSLLRASGSTGVRGDADRGRRRQQQPRPRPRGRRRRGQLGPCRRRCPAPACAPPRSAGSR